MDKINLSLSVYNKDLLKSYADEQWERLQPKQMPAESLSEGVGRLVSHVFSLMGSPSSQSVAGTISVAFALAHGSSIQSEVATFIGRTLFGQEASQSADIKTSAAGIDVIKSLSDHVIEPGVQALEKMAKVTLESKASPLLSALGISTGGLTLPAMIGLVSLVAGGVLATSGGAYTLRELPNLADLVQVDPLTGTVRDAVGNELSQKDLADIREVVYRYDVVCRLMAADKDEVPKALQAYLSMDKNYNMTFKDGTVIRQDSQEMKRLQKAVERLQGANVTKRHKGIFKTINMLAKHMPDVQPQSSTPKSSADLKMTELVDGSVVVTDGNGVDHQFFVV